MTGVPDEIHCIECGGVAHRQSYLPPDDLEEPGDVVAFVCEDCAHRMDVVLEDGEDPLG